MTAYAFINANFWRGVFWLPFALDCTALGLVFFFYHPLNQYIHEEGKTTWDQIKATDFGGCFLFITGIVLFLLGISFGGKQYPWYVTLFMQSFTQLIRTCRASAGTIAPIVVGFALLIALGFYEAYAKLKYPIFPPEIFRNVRGFTVLQVATFLLGMLFYASAVIWPSQVQALYTQNNLDIGWYSSAGGFGGLAFSLFWGWSQKKFGHSHIQLTLAIGALTLVSGAQAIVSSTSNVGSTILVFLVYVFVSGASILSVSMCQLGVKHEFIGIASGVIVTARSLGGAVATTIYVSILENTLTAHLGTDVGVPLAENGVPPASIPAVIGALATGDLTSPALASISPKALFAAIAGLQQAYVTSFRLVYLVSIAFGVVGTVIVAFAANVDHLMTAKTDIKLAEGAHVKVEMDTGEGHMITHPELKE